MKPYDVKRDVWRDPKGETPPARRRRARKAARQKGKRDAERQQ